MIYGSNLNILWAEDPKMLGVRMARYKFVAKMLQGLRVVEVGAGDGWLSKIVKQSADVYLTDLQPQSTLVDKWDATKTKLGQEYDGAYALDVLEHVSEEDEFLENIKASVVPHGVVIIGMPSLESQPYASRLSKESHINCKTEECLRYLMERHFKRVFMFGMNDEVVHTGFGPMCQYRIALAIK